MPVKVPIINPLFVGFVLQYVNYSNITLKTAAPTLIDGEEIPLELENGDVEARINQAVLRVPECGQCEHCLEKGPVRKLCVKRIEARKQLVEVETKKILAENKGKPGKKRKSETKTLFPNPKKPKSIQAMKKKVPKMMKTAAGQVKLRVTSQGNKRMAIPDEHFPEFCRRIGAGGTGERMKLINQFAEEHPTVSVRQVTLKLGEITTKEMPACVKPPEKKQGRAFMFYLRPRFYKHLPPEERPEGWEKYAEIDERLWEAEQQSSGNGKRKKSSSSSNNTVTSSHASVADESITSEKAETASNVSPSVGDDDDEEDGEETGDEAVEPAVKKLRIDE